MAFLASVDIPVPVYVQKYLLKRYGKDHKVSKNSAIGIMIIQLATKYYMKPVKKAPEGQVFYSLAVTEYYYNQKVFRITKTKLKLLSKLLVKLFYEDLVNCAYRDVALKKISEDNKFATAKASIKQFLDFYEITENDLRLETAYMEYQRKKPKKIKVSKNQIASF
ncbi:hypothetical protein [Croceibacter atlanticus]|uniref:hypothetical protein n=1 Tax=Croceibacter atlanticus TaxID=313588 RepID=UPI0030DAED6D|tara:strand:+ start:7611 stop:8105 length:495 start_codon:yes stop_codon:yes gene_type:complete